MTLRFWYEVEAVGQGFEHLPALDSIEVDPAVSGTETLRGGLLPWAVDKLRQHRCDFGLYVADFSAWGEEEAQEYYLRSLYIVWTGDDVVCTHLEDNPSTFASWA